MTQAISLRLDEEAMRALRALEGQGFSRSDAVRRALVEAARREESLQTEVAAIAADDTDRDEVAQVQADMDELSEPW